VFNHIQMSFLGIGAAVALCITIMQSPGTGVRLFLFSTLAFCIGFLHWIVLFVYDYGRIHSFEETLSQALFGSFKHIMLQGSYTDSLKEALFLIFFQTPHLYLLFITPGVCFFFTRWKFSAASMAVL